MHLAFIFIFSSLIGVCVEVYPLLICLWLDMTCLFFSNQCWCFVLVAILKLNCFDNHNYFLPYIDEICMFLFVWWSHDYGWSNITCFLQFEAKTPPPLICLWLTMTWLFFSKQCWCLKDTSWYFFIKKYDKS